MLAFTAALSGSMTTGAFELPAGNRSESILGVEVRNIYLQDSDITVDLGLDLSQVKMKSNVETVYTPMFVSGTDTLRFQPFSVTGRNRMYWCRRNNALLPLTFYKGKTVAEIPPAGSVEGTGYRLTGAGSGKSGTPSMYDLTLSTPYRDWMQTASFQIDIETLGCANCVKANPVGTEPFYALAQNDFVTRSYFPEFLYVTPVAEAIKMREISARAYIDFPVNRIEIYPDYRRNPEELGKIRATIDSVKNDKDINITSLHISGTASPEGGYQNNIRLAKGRTEALKDYVQSLYRFPAGLITTSFEPVDWEGLAQFLEMVQEISRLKSRIDSDNAGLPAGGENDSTNNQLLPSTQLQTLNALDSIRFDQFQNINFDPATISYTLPDAGAILAIVDSDIEPFNRNLKIKQTYPDQYAWLLENVYPALRHSDYRIQFEIKTFTEVEEILDVMATQPSKLSLAELFVAANSQEPGSELYNRAFELAVTMYPEDETANLNAAVAAMQRGDMISAGRYLAKVTQETPETDYANAMYLLIQGNESRALEMFRSLSNSLNTTVAEKAAAAVQGLEEMQIINSRTFIPM